MGTGLTANRLEFSFLGDKNFTKLNCMMIAELFTYTSDQ